VVEIEQLYRERLWPSPAIWALAPGFGLVAGLVAMPLSAPAAAMSCAVTVVAILILLVRGTVEIRVAEGRLTAGPARIAVQLLGPAVTLDPAGMRRARGVELDARAFLCLRGWLAEGVRVPVLDRADPTPYWLISSRRPAALAAALAASVPVPETGSPTPDRQ
jgi:Protein of unknown function (DUF3093)